MNKIYDCIIIGGGQAGLSVGYFLKRQKLDFLILDKEETAGGAWLHTWDSLRLFSDAKFSSLSGWAMPNSGEEYPPKNEIIHYLSEYEKHYNFPIQRPEEVLKVTLENDIFNIQTAKSSFQSKTLVSATGNFHNPYTPYYPHIEDYKGLQMHSAQYRNNDIFYHKNVLIVGGGNSAAQILAEVSKVAETTWVTLEEPVFLPDDVDGRYLFDQANAKYLAMKQGLPAPPQHSLANIVMLDIVKEARERGVLKAVRPFQAFYDRGVVWQDGSKDDFDAVIWCTGFKANLSHLSDLNIIKDYKIPTQNTKCTVINGLWLVGYGNWTGYASATLYGVGKTARDTAAEIGTFLSKS